ncbi:MAG: glycosyltransferase family 39 protein [Sporolactobacillus sp.]|uniref:glycosyltransferase family 39 protein n=1 Tax=Sporolactobacillus sp. STSJ-5 TaxID=2965076 RepID=UPI0021067964|nr:glycosyltransferase family 39 protein [Sporolactobacillus sp. STSJ-5]
MATISRVKRSLIYLFSIAFTSCFLAVLAISFFYPLIFNHNQGLLTTALSLALFAFIVVLFFIAFFRWIGRLTDRTVKKISGILFLLMLLFEGVLIVTFHTIIPPIIDGGHTYAEALYLLAHGHASSSIYFKIYPNNIPFTLLRYFLYSMFSFVHFSSYMFIDRLFCALTLDAGIFLSWKLIQKKFNDQTACLFLVITLTCLPLFLYTMYFYTDTAAITFPVLLLYLWHLYTRSWKIHYILLLGIALGVGELIRPNLILFLPALGIYMFLVLNWKKALINLAVIGILISSVGFAFQGVERHFGYVQDPSLSMPSIHWVMLGLSRDGGYNAHDYQLTRKQPDPALKKQLDRQQIADRIKKDGTGGLIYLWAVKTARTWGVGAHGYYWYTHLSSHPTKAYQYLFNHKNQVTIYIIQVFYIVTIFLLILSVLRYFRTKKADMYLLIQICLFGNFIFYVFFWEAEPRYSLLFTPYILLGAVYGFNELMYLLRSGARQTDREKRIGKGFRIMLAGGLLAAVYLCASAGSYAYTQAQSPQRSYIVDQRYSPGKKGIAVDAHHSVAQTFFASDQYNRISFGIRDVKGSAAYRLSVTDTSSKRILFTKTFAPSGKDRKQVFQLTHASVGTHNRIDITQIKKKPGSALILTMSGFGYEQRDAYPGGYLMQNGVKKGEKDLKFAVYQVADGPYLSNNSYGLLFSIPALMLLMYIYIALTMNQNESDGTSALSARSQKMATKQGI